MSIEVKPCFAFTVVDDNTEEEVTVYMTRAEVVEHIKMMAGLIGATVDIEEDA